MAGGNHQGRTADIQVAARPPAEPLRIIWQGQTKRTYLAYPASAPRLEIGMPYLVQITNPSGQQIATVFSIDPWLDMADNAANRIVTIGR
jgi:hypothetical protein